MEKSILALGAVLFVGLALFSTVKGTEKVLASSFVQSFQEPVTDTVPENEKPSKRKVKRAQRAIKERQQKVERKQRELQEAVEDMEQDVKKYSEEMGDDFEINMEIKELIEKNQPNIDNDINLKLNLKLDDIQKINEIELENLQQQIELLELDKIKPQIDAKIKVQLHRQQQMMAAQADQFKAQQQEFMGANADKMIRQKQLLDVQAHNFQLQKKIFDSVNKNFRLLHDKIKLNAITSIRSPRNVELDEVLQFLERNNVAKASEITSITLNEKELIVNDKKQPASLHEQLKKKYLNKSGDFINYVRKGDSIMISMQVHKQEPV